MSSRETKIQETLLHRNELQVPECTNYFMENLQRLAEVNYIPIKVTSLLVRFIVLVSQSFIEPMTNALIYLFFVFSFASPSCWIFNFQNTYFLLHFFFEKLARLTWSSDKAQFRFNHLYLVQPNIWTHLNPLIVTRKVNLYFFSKFLCLTSVIVGGHSLCTSSNNWRGRDSIQVFRPSLGKHATINFLNDFSRSLSLFSPILLRFPLCMYVCF